MLGLPFEKDETNSNPNEPVKRVSALPQKLVDRILEYQKEKSLPSEVEAARRLLDETFKNRDDMEKIINPFLGKLSVVKIASEVAKDVLVRHPLVNNIAFPSDGIGFALKNTVPAPHNVHISNNGTVLFFNDESNFSYSWIPNSKVKYSQGTINRSYANLDDSDVPF